jgi:peptidyl-prolyl cis-trans isomerase B (cyclophilin B)
VAGASREEAAVAGPNDKQNKNIARAKMRQQQERERAAKAAAQKRARITAGVVAALLVIGAGFGATQLLGNNDDSVSATDDATPDEDLVRDTVSPAPAGKTNCRYAPEEGEDTGGKKVDLPPLVAEAKEPYTVKITTNKGPVELKLDSEDAPCAVNSFVHLAREKFYDGTECHRILTDEGYGILQCGDPTGTGSGGAGYSFNDENLEGAEYKKGTVAMANRGANTNGSQFFLVFRDSTFPAAYTPFGTIEKDASFKTLESIADDGVVESDLGNKDKPKKKVTMEKVTVEGPPPYEAEDEDASASPSPSSGSKEEEDETASPSPSPSKSKAKEE